MKEKRPIAVTMGDPAGIGPELCARIAESPPERTPLLFIGNSTLLNETSERLGLTCRFSPNANRNDQEILIDEPEHPSLDNIQLGQVAGRCGAAAYSFIKQGISLAQSGKVRALVTAPIHKESLSAADIPFPGHTEMLAHHCDNAHVAMMLVNNDLRTVLVSIHVSLKDAINAVTKESVLNAIYHANAGALAYGIKNPRIAVAGLNPHAGEGGLFGREEIEVITPAIEHAQLEGLKVSGPHSGDTVFMQARSGSFDVVVAQYHDQGLIPVKYLGLEDGVNITLGLPIIRTSPDHGTAFDIAGKGIADPRSLITAIRHADLLAEGAKL